jgi:hypothetical protein
MDLRNGIFTRVDASGMKADTGLSVEHVDTGRVVREHVEFEEVAADSSEELDKLLHGRAERALLDSDLDELAEGVGYELVRDEDETSWEGTFVVTGQEFE